MFIFILISSINTPLIKSQIEKEKADLALVDNSENRRDALSRIVISTTFSELAADSMTDYQSFPQAQGRLLEATREFEELHKTMYIDQEFSTAALERIFTSNSIQIKEIYNGNYEIHDRFFSFLFFVASNNQSLFYLFFFFSFICLITHYWTKDDPNNPLIAVRNTSLWTGGLELISKTIGLAQADVPIKLKSLWRQVC